MESTRPVAAAQSGKVIDARDDEEEAVELARPQASPTHGVVADGVDLVPSPRASAGRPPPTAGRSAGGVGRFKRGRVIRRPNPERQFQTQLVDAAIARLRDELGRQDSTGPVDRALRQLMANMVAAVAETHGLEPIRIPVTIAPDNGAALQLAQTLRPKMEEAIWLELVGLLQRPTHRLDIGDTCYTQSFGSAELSGSGAEADPIESRLRPGATLSSVRVKQDKGLPTLRARNANLGVLTAGGAHVATRTARPDTVERLKELLVVSLQEASSAAVEAGKGLEDVRGVRRVGDHLEYRMLVLSALDRARLKAMVSAENERQMLGGLVSALDALFADAEEVWVKVAGESVAVRRPLLGNVVLGGVVGGLRDASHTHGLPVARSLCTTLEREARSQKETMKFAGVLTKLEGCLMSGRDPFAGAQALWNRSAGHLTVAQRQAFADLVLIATGKPIGGAYGDAADLKDPAARSIAHSLAFMRLAASCDIALVVSCKSGIDRTGAEVCLDVARREATASEPTRVYGICAPDEQPAFYLAAWRAAVELAHPIAREARGGGLKWKKQPTQEYLGRKWVQLGIAESDGVLALRRAAPGAEDLEPLRRPSSEPNLTRMDDPRRTLSSATLDFGSAGSLDRTAAAAVGADERDEIEEDTEDLEAVLRRFSGTVLVDMARSLTPEGGDAADQPRKKLEPSTDSRPREPGSESPSDWTLV